MRPHYPDIYELRGLYTLYEILQVNISRASSSSSSTQPSNRNNVTTNCNRG